MISQIIDENLNISKITKTKYDKTNHKYIKSISFNIANLGVRKKTNILNLVSTKVNMAL